MNNNMHDERQRMLADESIGKLLLKLSLPAGIGMFVMALYNVVDTIFIGQVVGPLGIAGLTIVFPFQMVVMGLGMIIGIGGASVISRALGATDIDKAERTLGNSIFLVIVLGALIPVIGLTNISFWLRLFGASETILPYSRDYLEIILLGTVFRIFAMGISQLVRAEGNARVPMISMLIGSGLNIVLDAIFILVLNMGIRGAAIATMLSQIVTSAYIIHYYFFQNSSLTIRLKNFILDRNVVREIITIGFGAFVRTTGTSLVTIIINRTLISYGGDLAVASFGMVMRIMMFIFMPIISIGQGLQPIIGFAYGAKRFDRLLRAIKLAMVMATMLSIISFLIIYFLPAPIFYIFTNNVSLVSVSSHASKIIFLMAYLIGFQIVGSVVFQALGRPVPTFLTATSRQILFLLPLIFILPNFWQIDGIWLSFPIADGLSFILTLALLIPQIRILKKAELTVRNEPLPMGSD
ncbi:MATE family efflux transporter [Chloroflexota bacterium]